MFTILLAVGVFAVFFLFMSVRLLFFKDGSFRGTCASQSPFLNKEGEACGYCGKKPGEPCAREAESKRETAKAL